MADITQIANTSIWTTLGVVVVGAIVMAFILIRDSLRFNVETDVWEQINGSYILHRVKGGVFKNDKGVRYFKTRKYGENNKIVSYREPNNEIYATYSTNWLNMKGFPRIIKKQIAFMNPFGDTCIPVRRSFINIKRGVDLEICSKDQCEFCKEGVDVDDFLKTPGKYLDKIKDMDSICEKHFTHLVNARYECIDQSDLSWMWKEIDEIKKEFGDWLTKYGVFIMFGAMLAFGLMTLIITYKMQPDLNEAIVSGNRGYIEALKIKQYEIANNVTIPTN